MIYYEKRGKGPAVVLLHGFPNDHSTWDPVLPALPDTCTFILPDFPGAGRSSTLPGPLSLEVMAAEVAGILEKEKIGKAIIAGHSMGGYTALVFARMFPLKTAALSLVHASAYADTPEKKHNRKKAIELIGKGALEKKAFLNAMALKLFAPSFAEQNPGVVQSVADKAMTLSAGALIAFYKAIMQRRDATQVLRQAPFPVQWIIGEEDTAAPMKDALEQAHIAAVNSISLYPACGHMSMLERPDELARDLSAFFNFVYPAP